MISFKSLFENIRDVVPDPKFLLNSCIGADAATVNPERNKTFLTNGLSAFPIKGKPVFSNGPRSLPVNPPNSPFDSWGFEILY